jgi:UDP-glucose 4-epimerase
MKVLITGGMGVIGSMVSTRFVQEGHRPVIMARHLDRNLIRPIEDKVDIELADVLDLPRVLSIIQTHKITHIIHTAALVGAVSNQNPPQSIHINVIGTLNILEAARFMKVQRVVYTSAKGIYGHIDGEYAHPIFKPLPEDHPKRPSRIYESAKLMGEHMGQFYQRTYGLEFVALRFSMTYGPGKTVRHGAMSILSQIIEGGYSGKAVRIEKGGDQKDDLVYNRDVAQGIYLACTAPKLRYDAYNIGMGVGYTLKDVAKEVKRIIPNADIQIGPGFHFLGGPTHYYSVYDITRAREDLGFSPQFPLGKGIEDYIETLKILGLLDH